MILLVYWASISLFLVLQLQRLSDVGEESVIVTANISDDTTSVLGSHFGEKFVVQSDLNVLKHQFLRYCAGMYDIS